MTRQFLLPFPLSDNTYWRHIAIGGRPRSLLSKRARRYRKDVEAALADDFRPALTGPLRVVVVYRAPDKRLRDVQNYHKGLLDALEHAGVYENDRQIWDFRACWDVSEAGEIIVERNGSACVVIEQIGAAPGLFKKH